MTEEEGKNMKKKKKKKAEDESDSSSDEEEEEDEEEEDEEEKSEEGGAEATEEMFKDKAAKASLSEEKISEMIEKAEKTAEGEVDWAALIKNLDEKKKGTDLRTYIPVNCAPLEQAKKRRSSDSLLRDQPVFCLLGVDISPDFIPSFFLIPSVVFFLLVSGFVSRDDSRSRRWSSLRCSGAGAA